MKVTTVSFSDLAKHNRMDAGFFVALEEVKDDLNALMDTMPKEEAIEKLLAIKVKPSHLNFLLPIVRGSTNRGMSEDTYHQVVKSDPFAVMALMKAHQDDILKAIEADLEGAKKNAEAQAGSLSSLKP